MDIKIRVTQDDIDAARKDIARLELKCLNCPVSKAMSRALDQTIVVEREYWARDGEEEAHGLPEKAQWFVDCFDKGYMVQPFEFSVNVE